MFEPCDKSEGTRRSPRSLLTSVGIHVAVLAALYWAPKPALVEPARYSLTPLFMPATALRSKVAQLPRHPMVAPRFWTRVAAPRLHSPAMELPLPPVPALTPQTAPLAIAPVASHPAPTQSNAAAFESAGMVAPPAVHPAEVRIGEFESQPAVAPPSNSERLRQETSFPQFSAEPDRRRESGLAQSAGFDQAPAPSPVKRRADTPLAGFGNASPPAQAAKPRALAEATPFDTARTAAPVPPPSVPHTGVGGFTPVEILSKPRPQYTEDGRRARVEGEITLEVLFAASGKARVLRTLNTLGHGLDESALRAAEDIRFRPATRGGSPEDTVATVRIDFRLAY